MDQLLFSYSNRINLFLLTRNCFFFLFFFWVSFLSICKCKYGWVVTAHNYEVDVRVKSCQNHLYVQRKLLEKRFFFFFKMRELSIYMHIVSGIRYFRIIISSSI